jgi:hypothetical protein
MTAEKRSAPRLRSFLKGKAIFNNRQSTLDCLVRDISATGARLEVSNAVLLPEVFDLHVPQKDTTYRVRISWRAEGEIGVEFEHAQGLAQAQGHLIPAHKDDLAARVHDLEVELAAQRILLAQVRFELEALRKLTGERALAS